MGDRINLSGKDVIVNTLKEMRGKKKPDIQTLRNSMREGQTQEAVAGVTASMSKIGARINGSSVFDLDVYAYNPKNSYSSSYTSDYYVNTGYVSGNGIALPVVLPNKVATFQPRTYGTWAIAVRKANALDEALSVYVVFPSPDANNAMHWEDDDGETFNPDSNGGAWIIGSFLYSASGISGLNVQTEATRPSDYLKARFMQIMNDVSGSDTADYINWAIAMGCDAIFKRLAAIEAFVSRLNVNNLTVGTVGTGFSFQALTDDGTAQHNKLFAVKYDNNNLFRVDVSNGRVYFGNGFWYQPSDQSIRSTGDNVVIASDGKIRMKDASVKGSIEASTFMFSDVRMEWLYLNYDGDSLQHYFKLTDYGAAIGDLIIINWSGMVMGEPQAEPSMAFILDDGAMGLYCTTTLVDSNGTKIEYIRGLSQIDYESGIRTTTNRAIKMTIQIYHYTGA